jgi:hypothetical protein
MCFDGDFTNTSGNNKHQVLGAKVANPKKTITFLVNLKNKIKSLYVIHSLPLDFAIWQNFAKKKTLLGLSP